MNRLYPLKVSRVVEETPDARSIVFDVPERLREIFRYQAGQFLTLEVSMGENLLRRCYSLASSPDCDPEHKVTVKRVDKGKVSNFINDKVRAGDTLFVLPPEGRFVLPKEESPLVLFAGGSGITPIISIIKSALRNSKREIDLFYANRDARSVIFADELRALGNGRLRVRHHLDAERGFAREEDVRSLIRPEAHHYLCGPGPFMDVVERALKDLPPERVHVERFVSPREERVEEDVASDTSEIEVELRGEKRTLAYEPGKSILKTALEAGMDAPYSCEDGFCGCCIAQLVEGEVHMAADDALTKEDKKKRLILTCQSKPVSKRCRVRYLD
jgi:3-ketosteroid 9alpha-monooxygenase subunit B